MTRELAVRIDQPLEFKPSDIIAQVSKIQAVMRASMRKGIHYGNVIPGVDKPMLLKPGAEKLCLTFRFAPSYEIRRQDLEGGHREFEMICTLRHQVTEMVLGQGVGSASTLESKWRFRWENMQRPVPNAFWSSRDSELLGGPDFVPRKDGNGKWWIYHRVEHDNPADYYNTIFKMAKKRSLVDCVLSCTAASDIFTHEPEDEEKDVGAGNGRMQTAQKTDGFKLS